MNTGTHAIENAQAWLENIVAMVKRLEHAETCNGSEFGCQSEFCRATDDQFLFEHDEFDFNSYHDADAAREAIEESPLSVEMRSGWESAWVDQNIMPAEFKILLTTGGPALRIVGELDQHGEPESARLEYQDWETPWTEVNLWTHGNVDDRQINRDALLAYARQFYYGS